MTIDTLSVQPRLINDPVDTADGAMPRQGETGVHDEDRIFIDYPIVRAGTDTPETIDMLPFDDASAQTEIEIEDEILEPSKALERLRWVVDELGFAPTSRREMTLAFGIYNTKLGISKYLNNVLGHQLKSFIKYLPEAEAEAKAAAAVKKITRQIKDFALDGRGNITMLGLLGREPGVSDGKLPTEWADQATTERAVRCLARRDAVHQALASGEMVDFKGISSTEYVANRLDTATIPVGLLPISIEETMREEYLRRDFWIKQLEGARQHMVSQSIAAEALEALGIRVARSH